MAERVNFLARPPTDTPNKAMKRILPVLINNKIQDCVIEHTGRVIKDDNGEPVWTNKDEGIAKCKGYVKEIVVYVRDESTPMSVQIIKIGVFAVKELFAHIAEIENTETEEAMYE